MSPLTLDDLRKRADARWTRWLADGLRHDFNVKRRFHIAAAVVVLGLTMWLVSAM